MRIGTTLLTLLTISCCETTKSIPPPAAERIQPRVEWRNLFEEVGKCSGVTAGNYDDIRWFKALELMYDAEGKLLAGAWYPYYPNDIYLARENVEPGSEWAEFYIDFNVKHEMLHYRLQTEGHPKEFYICNLMLENN